MVGLKDNVLEGRIESRLLTQCRQHGFMCLKFVSPARGGVPDRVIITPAGTVFVELKRPGGELEPRQRATHERMRRRGAVIYVVDDLAGVDALMVELSTRSPDPITSSAQGGRP